MKKLANKLVRISNFVRADEAFVPIRDNKLAGLPSMVAVTGPAGCGKTAWVGELLQANDGVAVRGRALWTERTMLLDILQAIGPQRQLIPTKTAHALYLQLSDWINSNRYRGVNPIVAIDEVDYVLDRGRCLSVLRDLHEETRAIVCLISIHDLAKKIAAPTPHLEAITTRLGATIEFRRIGIEDATLIARERLSIKLDRPLVQHCLSSARGSIRPLLAAFSEIERVAKRAGEKALSFQDWRRLATLSQIRRSRAVGPVTAPMSLSRVVDLASGACADDSDEEISENEKKAGAA